MNRILCRSIRRLNLHNKTSLLWIISHMKDMKNNRSQSIIKDMSMKYPNKYKEDQNQDCCLTFSFMADGSSVQYRVMGIIEICIHKGNRRINTLKLDDVLIVPNLDRRLFSINSFLSRGNNWVYLDKKYVHLGINDGPTIKIPITSL